MDTFMNTYQDQPIYSMSDKEIKGYLKSQRALLKIWITETSSFACQKRSELKAGIAKLNAELQSRKYS